MQYQFNIDIWWISQDDRILYTQVIIQVNTIMNLLILRQFYLGIRQHTRMVLSNTLPISKIGKASLYITKQYHKDLFKDVTRPTLVTTSNNLSTFLIKNCHKSATNLWLKNDPIFRLEHPCVLQGQGGLEQLMLNTQGMTFEGGSLIHAARVVKVNGSSLLARSKATHILPPLPPSPLQGTLQLPTSQLDSRNMILKSL